MTDLVRALEERTARAWPASEIVRVGGWECRFAGGYTGRANSVNPYGPATGGLEENLRRCEELFRERELRPVFRITPLVDPPDLDARLAERGYVRRSETRVLVRDAGSPPAGAADPELHLSERLASPWLELLSKWAGIPREFETRHRSILESIRPARVFALLRSGGSPVACGLAVREEPWVGLFDLATAPEHRRRGFGARLVGGLLRWGAAGGAPRAYLQVVAGNEPALRLYHREGFREAYRYAYRVSTEASPFRLPKAPH